MKTVLLLGAGVTRAARPKISKNHRAPLDADFFDIAASINSRLTEEVIDCLETLVGDYAVTLSGSLETATSYLYMKSLDSSTGSIYHKAFLSLLNLLNEVLAHTTNPIAIGPRGILYRFILSELRHVDAPEDLSIVTFNYDLVLERTLEAITQHGRPGTFVFPGCYRLDGITRIPPVRGQPTFKTEEYAHEGVAVMKLHGSMNWQSNHTSNNPTPSALLNPNREMHVLDSPEIQTSLSWRRRSRMVHLKPIIVPPISGKRGVIHRRLLSLWERASKTLRNADRIVVSGYSCPPLDLEARILISESMRANQNKKLYVIDPNPAAAVKFLELCGVDHITIYSSLANWVRDAT